MRRARSNEDKLSTLYRATALFIIVVMIRPQDMIPVLGYLKPGVISTAILFAAMASFWDFPYMKDAIIRSYIFYIGVLAVTLIVVVNHYHWFWTLFSVVSYVAAFVIAMPVLLQSEKYRWRLLRIIFISFGVAAIYALLHKGTGPGDWLGDENDMACALSLGAAYFAAFGIKAEKKALRWLAWSGAVLCTIGIAIAGSRGGFLGFLGVVLGLLYFSGRLWRSAVVAIIIGAAAYPLIPQEVRKDFASISDTRDETRRERIYSWKKGVEMFYDSPLIGVGAGNYPWRIAEYQARDTQPEQRWRSLAGRVAHSSYVTVLAESGALGAASYALVIFLVLLRARSIIYRRDPVEEWRRTLAIAAGAGMFGAGVAATFITFSYAPPLYLLAGLAVAISDNAPKKGDVARRRIARISSTADSN